ncbi:MAG: permease-like cell division protein FtsX [Pseudomonadota bacterium]|nr:permease-like cell division protein FtsX [Pseudomonadota bacterium]
MLHQHGHAMRLALQRLAGAPLAHLFTILVIGLSLALPALLYRIVTDASALARAQTGPPRITVFLRADAGEATQRAVRSALDARSDLASVRFVSPAEALGELQRRSGLDDVLAGLERNPLPPAFVVQPRNPEPRQLQALQVELKRIAGTDLVQLDAEWARRLYALGAFLERGLLLLAAVLVAGVVTTVVNTLRLQILSAREELEVCKLMGASDAFVRRPFLYFGILQMLFGAALALAAAEGARMALNAISQDVLASYGLHFVLQPPDPGELAAVVGFAVVIGWFSAAWSVWMFLRALRPR